MVGLIKILVGLIKAFIFLEKMGIPVEDLIAQLEGMLGGESEEETTAEVVTDPVIF